MTNPKFQITQQSRIDNCRQVKGFLYFYSKQKRERQEQWQNYFTFSRVTSEKKGLISQDSATIDVIKIYRLLTTHARLTPASKRGEGIMQMKGPIFRLARGILLHPCDNVASSSASSSASSYINILWISLTSFDPPYM